MKEVKAFIHRNRIADVVQRCWLKVHALARYEQTTRVFDEGDDAGHEHRALEQGLFAKVNEERAVKLADVALAKERGEQLGFSRDPAASARYLGDRAQV